MLQWEENQHQARLISALSQALHDNTAATAPTEDDDAISAISTASLNATRPGRRSMNADGASGAGCSQRPAGTAGRSTDTDQSALRHQRGGDNPNSGAGGLPSPGTQTLISGSGHGIRVLSRSHTTDSEESLDFPVLPTRAQRSKVLES